MGKPLTQSMTAWGVVVIAAVNAAESVGLVPAGAGEQVAKLAEIVGWSLAGIGARRALGGIQ